MSAVLFSIKPQYCELIANGEKTVEVRKTKPKLETPFKCYIYCTKNKHPNGHDLLEIHIDGKIHKANCKVIGEFVCKEISCTGTKYGVYLINEETKCGLTAQEVFNYGNGKTVYFWHISDLKIYDKPKELSEFYRDCNRDCMECEFGTYDMELHDTLCELNPPGRIPIKRPPQSFCYVEEVQA